MKAPILALLVGVFAPTSALAQESPPPESREVSFADADLIRGETAQASGIPITILRRPGTGTLIRPRTSFRPELVKSIENL